MTDLTRTAQGSSLTVDVGNTTITIDTSEKRHIVIDAANGSTVEVVLADEEFAPSTVLVDGMSLWTS
jgi:hypothetical protein